MARVTRANVSPQAHAQQRYAHSSEVVDKEYLVATKAASKGQNDLDQRRLSLSLAKVIGGCGYRWRSCTCNDDEC